MKTAFEAVNSAMERVAAAHRDLCQKWRDELNREMGASPEGWNKCVACGSVRSLDEGESAVAFRKGSGSLLTLRPCTECVIRRFLIGKGVPESLARCSFGNWEDRTPKHKAGREKAAAFAEGLSGVFLIRGKTSGLGKSHLAVAVMRKAMGGIFVDHATVGREIRRGYADKVEWKDQPEHRLSDARGLVLDDLGFGSASKDERRIIQDAMYARANAGKSKWTVVTTNMAPDELREFLEPRVARRLMDQLTDWIDLEPKAGEKSK